jgi:hypothetical protein
MEDDNEGLGLPIPSTLSTPSVSSSEDLDKNPSIPIYVQNTSIAHSTIEHTNISVGVLDTVSTAFR